MAALPKKKKANLSLSSRMNLALYGATVGSLAKVRPPRPKKPGLSAASRVLVFSSAGLGDTLLDSVAIRALAESFPGIHIEAVVHHRRPELCRHNPLLKRLHFLRKGPFGFLKLFSALKAAGPWDAILYLSCLDPEARSLGYLLAPDVTIGLAWRTDMESLCAWNLDEPPLRRAHLCHQALRVAELTGARIDQPRMVYEVHEADRLALDERLRELSMPSQPRVIFQLGGGGAAYRDWPAGHFVELARRLHAESVGPIFLLGGPDHRAKSETVLAQSEGLPLFNVTGRLALPLSAALIERAACLVSTDTGIMHLGFALRTPTVALLHPRPGRDRVGPLCDLDVHEVLALPKPPGYRDPSDARMESIRPEDVFEATQRVLTRSKS